VANAGPHSRQKNGACIELQAPIYPPVAESKQIGFFASVKSC
jgi:hypothetical protein